MLRRYTGLLPGAAEATQILQKEFGLLLGSTTGFTRPMVDVLEAAATKQARLP